MTNEEIVTFDSMDTLHFPRQQKINSLIRKSSSMFRFSMKMEQAYCQSNQAKQDALQKLRNVEYLEQELAKHLGWSREQLGICQKCRDGSDDAHLNPNTDLWLCQFETVQICAYCYLKEKTRSFPKIARARNIQYLSYLQQKLKKNKSFQVLAQIHKKIDQKGLSNKQKHLTM